MVELKFVQEAHKGIENWIQLEWSLKVSGMNSDDGRKVCIEARVSLQRVSQWTSEAQVLLCQGDQLQVMGFEISEKVKHVGL